MAIKVLPASLSENVDRPNRFEPEAQAAGALNHPNILSIFHVGTHEGAPKPLFKTRTLSREGAIYHEYHVSPDGQKFLIGTLIGDPKAAPPAVIMNWTALLKK